VERHGQQTGARKSRGETEELQLANIRNWKKVRAALLSNMADVDSS
jgi:hypothetical protein